MFGLRSSLLFCATLVAVSYAADLISGLTQDNISVRVLSPGQAGYDASSTAFNLRFTIKPAAIVFPNTAQDVSTVLQIAQQFNYPVVARSGGHSYVANSLGGKDGSVVIDMSNFKQISVDPNTHIATIGPGNRLGNIALALNDAGRALPHGVCPYIGMGGHSGHGGFGFASRLWGLTLDTIQSLDVVLANGTIAKVSENSYPDLFFAFRGASSSIGIVTSIEVKTFPAPDSLTIFVYNWDLSAAEAASATEQFQKFVQGNIPQEFGAEINLYRGSSSGRVSWNLVGGWYAPADQFEAVVAPLLATLPAPANVTLTPGSYIDGLQRIGGLGRLDTTSTPDVPNTFYAKSLMTPEESPMSCEAITAFMNYLSNEGFEESTNWFVQIELYGGPNSAINSVAHDATAFVHRSSLFTIQFYTSSANGQPPFPESGITFLDGIVSSIVDNEPSNWPYGAYPNYIDLIQNWQNLYYGSNYPRLQSLKEQYDPKNLFRFPESIEE